MQRRVAPVEHSALGLPPQILGLLERTGRVSLSAKRTGLVVVDMENDSNHPEGFFAKKLRFDISQELGTERSVVQLVGRFRKAGARVVYVRFLYDFAYISEAMRTRLRALGIDANAGLAHKGTWGSQLIEALPQPPDLHVVKSAFSAFAPRHSFAYVPGRNSTLESYLAQPASADAMLAMRRGSKTMRDHFQAAYATLAAPTATVRRLLERGEVVNLNAALGAWGVHTVVVVGGSTHVCVAACVASAAERGYHVVLPVDCVASEEPALHVAYLQGMGLFQAALTLAERLRLA